MVHIRQGTMGKIKKPKVDTTSVFLFLTRHLLLPVSTHRNTVTPRYASIFQKGPGLLCKQGLRSHPEHVTHLLGSPGSLGDVVLPHGNKACRQTSMDENTQTDPRLVHMSH